MEWKRGTVESNDLVGEKFRRIQVRPDVELDFGAGQYILVRINGQKANSYSLCCLPGSDLLEILVDIGPAGFPEPAGEGSRYIGGLVPGDRVEFSGPYGNFRLRDDGTDDKVLIATGSGISAVLPMAEEAAGDPACRVVLFWCLRRRENILFEDKLDWLTERYPNFNYQIVLSSPEGGWEGMRGHVTENVREWLSGGDSGLKNGISFYLCGNGEMVKDVKEMLLGEGVPEGKVYYEEYYDDGGREK